MKNRPVLVVGLALLCALPVIGTFLDAETQGEQVVRAQTDITAQTRAY
ncbi:hypothetical protein ACRARG_14520 [Pseudooceanicola sp. C21-150M6]